MAGAPVALPRTGKPCEVCKLAQEWLMCWSRSGRPVVRRATRENAQVRSKTASHPSPPNVLTHTISRACGAAH
eukprot:7391576-Prymnesium_polylepis.3